MDLHLSQLGDVSIVVVLRRNPNVSTRKKIFASQQTFHAVYEQYKQVFITKLTQLVEHCISVAVIITATV